MKVAIRADASLQIGTGHVMRCMTLADELTARGAQCQFLCRAHEGNLIEFIRGKGYIVHALPLEHQASAGPIDILPESPPLAHSHWLGTTQAKDAADCAPILATQRPDWLIVDHYALDEHWESALASHYRKLLVIDDLADRAHNADLLLDQNWHGEQTAYRYDERVPSRTIKLLGPHFALLKPEYSRLRVLMPPRDGMVGRVLVFLGGSDPTNQSEKVLKTLSANEFSGLLVDVVIGVNHPDPDGMASLAALRPATVLHRNLPSLAGLMARADLMISAGGSTTWERMCLGLPCLAISIESNQTATQHALMKAGYSDFLGHMGEVDDKVIAQALSRALQSPARLIQQSISCQLLVDGQGAKHVAQHLFK